MFDMTVIYFFFQISLYWTMCTRLRKPSKHNRWHRNHTKLGQKACWGTSSQGGGVVKGRQCPRYEKKILLYPPPTHWSQWGGREATKSVVCSSLPASWCGPQTADQTLPAMGYDGPQKIKRILIDPWWPRTHPPAMQTPVTFDHKPDRRINCPIKPDPLVANLPAYRAPPSYKKWITSPPSPIPHPPSSIPSLAAIQ